MCSYKCEGDVLCFQQVGDEGSEDMKLVLTEPMQPGE